MVRFVYLFQQNVFQQKDSKNYYNKKMKLHEITQQNNKYTDVTDYTSIHVGRRNRKG